MAIYDQLIVVGPFKHVPKKDSSRSVAFMIFICSSVSGTFAGKKIAVVFFTIG